MESQERSAASRRTSSGNGWRPPRQWPKQKTRGTAREIWSDAMEGRPSRKKREAFGPNPLSKTGVRHVRHLRMTILRKEVRRTERRAWHPMGTRNRQQCRETGYPRGRRPNAARRSIDFRSAGGRASGLRTCVSTDGKWGRQRCRPHYFLGPTGGLPGACKAPPIRRHRSSASTAPPSRCRHAGDAVTGPSWRDARPLPVARSRGPRRRAEPFPGVIGRSVTTPRATGCPLRHRVRIRRRHRSVLWMTHRDSTREQHSRPGKGEPWT